MAVRNQLESQQTKDRLVSQLINARLREEELAEIDAASKSLTDKDDDYIPDADYDFPLVDDTVDSPPEMLDEEPISETYGLEHLGMKNLGFVYHNLSIPKLVEHAVVRGEGELAANGALVVKTGKYTGRSPKDKFIVEEPESRDRVCWNSLNVPISEEKFDRLYQRVLDYVQGRDLYVFDGHVGADPKYQYTVRVVNEFAWQNLFVHQLFRRPENLQIANPNADFHVICVPGLQGDPELDGLHSEAFIVVHLTRQIVLIGGTHYGGEMKKSIFSLLNYVMTKRDVLPMHGAANIAADGHTALFFGLSGTGKTTLSADPDRHLIGDDEHGWSPEGVFNFEGGCYAKTIRLCPQNEPQIWSALKFGSLLENVAIDPLTRELDYNDDDITENTRAAYPLEYIPDCSETGTGNHPKTIIFLTADAFGVLPPISCLTREQAMYHFLSGYTSKLAGTERGITEPQSTFSACFGQCFFPLSPTAYAEMLGDKLKQHPETHVFLINTGWSGGPYGVGQRISIKHTRAIVSAALNGSLNDVKYHQHPIFKLWIPDEVPGVPKEMLDPKNTWSDPAAYDAKAHELAVEFDINFHQFKAVSDEIAAESPSLEV